MAIRLNEDDAEDILKKPSRLGSVMTNGAPLVGLIGGAVCLVSTLWALFGRPDGNSGGIAERWEFLLNHHWLLSGVKRRVAEDVVVYIWPVQIRRCKGGGGGLNLEGGGG
ncbi:hypothetical protein U1Q18_002355 [Sarracenia purpurea var. burkii]